MVMPVLNAYFEVVGDYKELIFKLVGDLVYLIGGGFGINEIRKGVENRNGRPDPPNPNPGQTST
jgi:hypothetical protein